MTEVEAEALDEVSRLNAQEPTQFCPLIKSVCRKDCVCFRPAEVVKNRAGVICTLKAECVNAMFFNECGCNG